MTKWSHNWSNSKSIGDLVDGSKPRANVGDAAGDREVHDVVKELLGRLDPVLSNSEPEKVDLRGTKLKLPGVEGATTPRSSNRSPCRPHRSCGSRTPP